MRCFDPIFQLILLFVAQMTFIFKVYHILLTNIEYGCEDALYYTLFNLDFK